MLAHCAASQKVMGLIPDMRNGKCFQWLNPSDHIVALELTRLTEISTGNISWGVKAAGTQGWQH